MFAKAEAGPTIRFDVQEEPLGDFVAKQEEVGSHVYIPLSEVDFHRYYKFGCTVHELTMLIFKVMTDEEQAKEAKLAADALDLMASIPVDTITLPVFEPEDEGEPFHFVLPGGSSGEEMSELSFKKTQEAKKRRYGQA